MSMVRHNALMHCHCTDAYCVPSALCINLLTYLLTYQLMTDIICAALSTIKIKCLSDHQALHAYVSHTETHKADTSGLHNVNSWGTYIYYIYTCIYIYHTRSNTTLPLSVKLDLRPRY